MLLVWENDRCRVVLLRVQRQGSTGDRSPEECSVKIEILAGNFTNPQLVKWEGGKVISCWGEVSKAVPVRVVAFQSELDLAEELAAEMRKAGWKHATSTIRPEVR